MTTDIQNLSRERIVINIRRARHEARGYRERTHRETRDPEWDHSREEELERAKYHDGEAKRFEAILALIDAGETGPLPEHLEASPIARARAAEKRRQEQ